jgi:general secretion pathway protein B
MSYILDALRKADAERQRGAVPGLHDQAGAAASGAGPGRGRRLPLIIGLLVVTALVGVLWVYRGLWPGVAVPPAQDRERQAAPVQPPAAEHSVQSPAPAAGLTVAPAPEPLAATPAPGASPAPVSGPAPALEPAAAPAPVPAPAGLAAPNPVLTPTPQASAPVTPKPAPPGTAAVTPPPAATAPQTLPRLADLPEAQRRELPPMVVSGAVQSPDPASRMLILDGQVLREGDAPAPGLVLERIGPRAAVFSRGGLRFEIPL